MKRKLISAALLCVVTGAGVFWFLTQPVHVDRTALDKLVAGDVKNGEHVFYAGGCASCHAAPGATGDVKLVLAGGHELKTDFGTFIAPNISPSSNGLSSLMPCWKAWGAMANISIRLFRIHPIHG
jgi:mono/diheme cytochrome c family protein